MSAPAALVLAFLAGASPALAHGGHAVALGDFWVEWRPDPLLSSLIVGLAAAYVLGIARLWRRAGFGRGVRPIQSLAFGAGMAMLALALISPLDTLTGTLLTAHMVQHALLIAAAPPLLLLGRPDAALAFALPGPARRNVAGSPLGVLAAVLRRLARPLPAALLHGLALWVWHAPGPFQAALQSRFLHDFEHASFFVTALLFWQSVIVAARSPATRIAAILATLATLIHSGLLGALITLTGRLLYPAYAGAELWGLSPIEDQQLAGLVMWVPAGAIYLLAGLLLAARLIGSEEPVREPGRVAERQEPHEPVAPATG
jgi:putative membrane protein